MNYLKAIKATIFLLLNKKNMVNWILINKLHEENIKAENSKGFFLFKEQEQIYFQKQVFDFFGYDSQIIRVDNLTIYMVSSEKAKSFYKKHLKKTEKIYAENLTEKEKIVIKYLLNELPTLEDFKDVVISRIVITSIGLL